MGTKEQIRQLEEKQKELEEKLEILKKIFVQMQLQFEEFKKGK